MVTLPLKQNGLATLKVTRKSDINRGRTAISGRLSHTIRHAGPHQAVQRRGVSDAQRLFILTSHSPAPTCSSFQHHGQWSLTNASSPCGSSCDGSVVWYTFDDCGWVALSVVCHWALPVLQVGSINVSESRNQDGSGGVSFGRSGSIVWFA